jgi:hypothetical protein
VDLSVDGYIGDKIVAAYEPFGQGATFLPYTSEEQLKSVVFHFHDDSVGALRVVDSSWDRSLNRARLSLIGCMGSK